MFSASIQFGSETSVQLNLWTDGLVAECRAPRQPCVDDARAAVTAALADPIDFPPLAEATVPGDRIVLAIEPAVPKGAAVVTGVVENVLRSCAAPRSISLVQSEQDPVADQEPLAQMLSGNIHPLVDVITHNPRDRTMLAYLAASHQGKPIYLNRAIGEADLLISIGCIRPEGTLGYVDAPAGPFPTFADEPTQQRFHSPQSSFSSAQRKRRQREAEEAAWLLGSRFTVQVVPGCGDRVLHVLAGDVDSVRARGSQLAKAAWSCSVPRRASLVVASIEGGPDQQTWDNVARSLSAAMRIVEEGGAIVIFSDLDTRPGPSICHLAHSNSLDAADRQIHRDRLPDAVAASQLVKSLRRVKVYLLSRLPAEVVEDLGIAHVSRPDEVSRLSKIHPSCILLSNSQHVIPSLEQELASP